MKLPNDLGRKEGTAAAVGTFLLTIVYCYIFPNILWVKILGMEGSVLQKMPLPVFLVIVFFCLYAGFLTMRFLLFFILRRRAYHIRKGKEWQKWRSHIKGTGDDA